MSSSNERVFIQYSKVELVKESFPEDAYEKFAIGTYNTEPQKQIFIIFYTFAGIPSMKLEASCDSLDFLYECDDLLKELATVDKNNFKPDDLYYILLALGLRDVTNELNSIASS